MHQKSKSGNRADPGRPGRNRIYHTEKVKSKVKKEGKLQAPGPVPEQTMVQDAGEHLGSRDKL